MEDYSFNWEMIICYDGYSFKKFLHDKNDSTSLPNSPVERLFEDEQGDFIVSTTSVFAKMDKTTHHFQTVKMKGYEYSDRKNRAFVSSRPGVKPYFNVDFIWFNVSTKDLPLSDLQKTYLEKSEQTTRVHTDPIFIIGNGYSNTSRSNAMTVLKNAKTGINIGNGLPQALLHLKAPEASFDMHNRLENFAHTDYAI